MSDEGFEPIDTTGVDVEAAVAAMRGRIAGLGESIVSLQRESVRLMDSAAARMVVGVLEAPPVEPSVVVEQGLDSLAALSDSVEAMGRHAVAPPEDFDPRPFDPAETGDAPILTGAHGVQRDSAALDSVAAAPAFEPDTVADGERPEGLPAFEVRDRADTFGAPAASLSPRISPDHPSVGGVPRGVDPGEVDADQPGATVLEFTPRSLNDPAEAAAFGALADTGTPNEPQAEPAVASTDSSGVAPAGADPAPGRHADGLDALASDHPAGPPPEWDSAADEEAFEKFFSSDVEPEPAQRWLLNE